MGLRITALQLPATWGEPHRVLDAVDGILRAGPETDLVLLPEASLTGYVSPEGDFDLSPYAEPREGPLWRAASDLARDHGVHVVAPTILRHEGGACANAMVLHAPHGGALFTYEKRHPWFPETWATPGPAALPVVTIAGVKITIAICYDVHFLASESADALEAADLLLFPSAWVDEHDTKPALLEDLARRFDLWIANANWSPGVVRLPGQGGSCILDPTGRPAAIATHDTLRIDAIV